MKYDVFLESGELAFTAGLKWVGRILDLHESAIERIRRECVGEGHSDLFWSFGRTKLGHDMYRVRLHAEGDHDEQSR